MAGSPPPQPDLRKTVTVLFCDVTGSTELGERLDPEALRRVLLRYFEEMRAVLERHGGTVEKFIGDAVMGVFGIPTVHEDDAFRAVRAGAEMRQRLMELNDELDREWGVRLDCRIGLATGEVFVGEGGTLATGDTVNVAARLQQTAEPGQILIGDGTYRLVAHAVRAWPLDELALKGKRTGIPAWRVDSVVADAPALLSRLDARFVGRKWETGFLQDALAQAVAERRCELVTVFGAPGVGKSRLASEFGAAAAPARVAVGRCLAYGDGITFWPVTEVVRQLAGIRSGDSPEDARAKIGALVPGEDGELVCRRVADAIGLGAGDAATPELFWALRKLVEAIAAEEPLVLVVEDIHWAEPTLLDLLEYLADRTAARVLLLCLARPELLDARPTWATGRATLGLEPLRDRETQELIRALLDEREVPEEVAAVVARTAEGNPLFLEELVWTLIDDGSIRQAAEGWVATRELTSVPAPPSVSALLAARLDRLEPDERAVVQRAAVVGKQFWWSAVAELSPPELRERVPTLLHALVRRKLVRPDDSTGFVDEDAFRFVHILVRDAAYRSLPKQLRADLHERFADWLARRAGERLAEYEEIVGYHLEQAFRARAELGPLDDRARDLVERAASVLGAAGRKAFARADAPAAVVLLDRALALMTDQDPARLDLMRELSTSLWSLGEVARAEALLDGVIEAASLSNDRGAKWHALLERASRREMVDPDADADELLRVGKEAAEVFAAARDDLGLARALRRISFAHQLRCRYAAGAEAAERALVHAERARDSQERSRLIDALCTCLLYGPTPVDEGVRRCEQLLEAAAGNRLLEANVAASLAGLTAMKAEFDEARALRERAERIYHELGLRLALAGLTQISGQIELLADDPAAAERELRRGYEILAEVGSIGLQAALLAEALYQQGNYEEAAGFAQLAERSAGGPDIACRVLCQSVRARLEAHEDDAAAVLGRDAVTLAATTDALNMHADALMAFADALVAAGRTQEAASALRDAAALYERKHNLVGTRKATVRLAGSVA